MNKFIYDIRVEFINGDFSQFWSIYPPAYENSICTIKNASGMTTDIPIRSIKFVNYVMVKRKESEDLSTK